MLRTTIILIIFLLCAAAGFFKSYKLKCRCKNLCDVKAALSVLQTHIRFSKSEISIAMRKSACKNEAGRLFISAAEGTQNSGAAKAWTDAVEEYSPTLYFTDEDKSTLLLLSSRLGMTDESGQLSNIEYVCNLLDVHIASARYDADKYCRLYSGGGVLAGLFLCLIII